MKVKFDIALDDKGYVEISDDGFEVTGWITLKLTRLNESGTDEVMSVEVHAEELSQALLPFLDRHYKDKENWS